jgi:excisionase family DNA binding protein
MIAFGGEAMSELESVLRGIVRDELQQVIREELAVLEKRNLDLRRRDEALLHVKEAARYLGIGPSTLYRKAETIAIASVKIGNRLMFKMADLDAYIASKRRSPELVAVLANRTRGK